MSLLIRFTMGWWIKRYRPLPFPAILSLTFQNSFLIVPACKYYGSAPAPCSGSGSGYNLSVKGAFNKCFLIVIRLKTSPKYW